MHAPRPCPGPLLLRTVCLLHQLQLHPRVQPAASASPANIPVPVPAGRGAHGAKRGQRARLERPGTAGPPGARLRGDPVLQAGKADLRDPGGQPLSIQGGDDGQDAAGADEPGEGQVCGDCVREL
uniref:Uncharacterized protein n=1 Tax=Ixodes ricinus TaxID=34613 RepID=A0A6B0UPU9_IXORI